MSYKVDTKALKETSAAVIFPGEIQAINQVLECGERYGYGNMMSWLAAGWARKVPQLKGEIISRTPYPDNWLKE